VDDIVIFKPLGASQLGKIIELRLDDLRKLLADRHISLELTEAARQIILTAGTDVAYGARPLKRAIQRMVQDPLAMKILNGEVLHGAHIKVDVDHATNKLSFEALGKEALV
jgi:ATP-dependent Clp protease ATP-binding subunit ClpB